MKTLICSTLALAIMASLVTTASAQDKKGILWLGSGLNYEFKPKQDSNLSVALGVTAWVKNEGGNSRSGIGPNVEALMYSQKERLEGWAYGLRAGNAMGTTYVAPSIMFTGKGKSVVGRGGLYFPMGKDMFPLGIEMAIGFRL